FFIGDDRWPNQPYLAKYRQRLSDLGISDRFVFLGFSSEVHNLIQGLDIVTLPSWWEGHPLIVLEALASRKSVIASAVGGVPEIILHEETGLLVPPKNPAALAQEICRLIAEPELRSQLGEAGCQRVRQRFDETDMIQNILNLYQEVMAA
ncbi:MAG: glycosyltransferase family 4 protein, partial [Cyanobacteria bacterium J06576_12]